MESGVPQVLPRCTDELLDCFRRHPEGTQQLEGKAAEASVEACHLPLAQLSKFWIFWPRVAWDAS